MRVLSVFKKNLLIPGLVFLITLALYRELTLHIGTHLLDWLDYPYYAWLIDQNVTKLTTLSTQGFFNTNIFYPFEGSLLFSDLLLPQSLIALIFSFFTQNPIALLNLTFLFTLFLNSVSSYYMWKQFFTDNATLFFGTLVTSLSPFFFLQAGHFQMITLWPFFTCLGLLFSQKPPALNRSLGIGLLIGVQFIASVYLAVFLLAVVTIYYLVYGLHQPFKLPWSKSAVISLGLGLLLIAPVVYKYTAVQKAYGIKRSAGEYITYSAHPTDYLFTNSYRSVGAKLLAPWNRFNQHTVGERAAFPSFALSATALLSLISIKKTKGKFSISISTETEKLFFVSLIAIGLVFSLGPRLSSNGSYLSIPLPYFPLLKLIPLLEPIRATMRWSLLLYLGLTYFSLKTLSSIHLKRKALATVALTGLYIIEVFPIVPLSHAEPYYPDVYSSVAENCQEHQSVLLEYPFNQNRPGANVATNLSYKTKMELASTQHGCLLVNGYSGYEPLDFIRFEHELDTSVRESSSSAFFNLLDQRNAAMIKLNKQELYPETAASVSAWLESSVAHTIVVNDENYILVEKK